MTNMPTPFQRFGATFLPACSLAFGISIQAMPARAPADSTQISTRADSLLADEKAFLLILTPGEKSEFQKLPSPAEKTRWRQIYWKRRDPTPTTEKNELQEDFQRRVEHARKWYGAPFDEDFDDRGRIYVRYGEPADKFVQPIGELDVRPNESWAYPEIAKGLVFDFVERGGYYKLVNDLSAALGITGEVQNRYGEMIRLYQQRAYLDPGYDAIAGELSRALSEGGITRAQMELTSFASKGESIRGRAPAMAMRHLYKEETLPIALSLARFRQGDNVRAEIYYGVPYNHLHFVQRQGRWLAELRGEIVMFGADYEMIAQDSVRTVCVAPTPAARKSGAFISQFNFALPPRQYHLALRLENPGDSDSAEGNRLGILRSDFSCPSFTGNELQLSDIQLSPNIRVAQSPSRFVKNKLEIVPLPGLAIQKQRPLHVYFEIYHLTPNAQGETSYEIEYSVKQSDGKAGLLAQLAGSSSDKKKSVTLSEKRTGKSPNQFERIVLDLSALEAGKVELAVTVRDLVAGKIAMAMVPLRLEEGKR
jgi:GWxTD domain-containing protein